MQNPPTNLDLDEIASRAAHLYEYVNVTDEAAQPDFDQLTGTDVPALLAYVRRLQGQRKYLITQLAKRDAESGAGDRALREFLAANPDEDEMAASLARDGFGPDEIVETLSRPIAAKPAEACGKCRQPFDPADTRFDGHARHKETPYCRSCVDLCHEATDAFHRCVICNGQATR